MHEECIQICSFSPPPPFLDNTLCSFSHSLLPSLILPPKPQAVLNTAHLCVPVCLQRIETLTLFPPLSPAGLLAGTSLSLTHNTPPPPPPRSRSQDKPIIHVYFAARGQRVNRPQLSVTKPLDTMLNGLYCELKTRGK